MATPVMKLGQEPQGAGIIAVTQAATPTSTDPNKHKQSCGGKESSISSGDCIMGSHGQVCISSVGGLEAAGLIVNIESCRPI